MPDLATEYYYLLFELWKLKSYPYNPENIKRLVADKNPLFQAYNQNDST